MFANVWDVSVKLRHDLRLLDVIVVLLSRYYRCPYIVELVSIFQVGEDHVVNHPGGAVNCVLILSNVDTLDDGALDISRCP